MTSEEYGQYIDDFELDKKIGLIPEDFDLTSYIEQRRREFESKADGGRIGFDLGGFERVQKLAKDLFGKEVKCYLPYHQAYLQIYFLNSLPG